MYLLDLKSLLCNYNLLKKLNSQDMHATEISMQ
jgi:hypothetical protein